MPSQRSTTLSVASGSVAGGSVPPTAQTARVDTAANPVWTGQ
jgi:hypothetical protein